MRAYIKKLQSKSEETRKKILIGALIVCMSLVGVVWVNSLGYRFGNQEKTAQIEETIKPFALFGQSIGNAINGVTASVGNISEFKKEEIRKVEVEKQIDMIPVEKE